MLNAALTCMALGLVVWAINWTSVAVMPTQMYWFFTVGGYVPDGDSCGNKAPHSCMVMRCVTLAAER
jgi:hypothetical protein